METRLIVGLGNPGADYVDHRHNVGQRITDSFVSKNPGFWKGGKGFRWREVLLKHGSIFVIQPLSYMNLSGRAVMNALEHWDFDPDEMLVVHDDLDLELGKIKFSFARGAGGHNGVQSVIDQISTNEFNRLRFGIGRPQGRTDVADFVLKPYSKSEMEDAMAAEENAVYALNFYLNFGKERAQERFH